jgi:hypothetical protein
MQKHIEALVDAKQYLLFKYPMNRDRNKLAQWLKSNDSDNSESLLIRQKF